MRQCLLRATRPRYPPIARLNSLSMSFSFSQSSKSAPVPNLFFSSSNKPFAAARGFERRHSWYSSMSGQTRLMFRSMAYSTRLLLVTQPGCPACTFAKYRLAMLHLPYKEIRPCGYLNDQECYDSHGSAFVTPLFLVASGEGNILVQHYGWPTLASDQEALAVTSFVQSASSHLDELSLIAIDLKHR